MPPINAVYPPRYVYLKWDPERKRFVRCPKEEAQHTYIREANYES